ncbi:MAG: hypothetical protein ACE5I3_03665 [Phycisphaerae bacterium]
MNQGRNKAAGSPILSRSKRGWCAILALAAAALLTGTACDDEAAGRAFRDAAASSLESGVKNIMDGIIDGLFAVVELGTEQDSGTGTDASTTTTGEGT